MAKDEQANADEHLNNLLRWIIAHSDRRKDLGNVDFVTWRGQVTKMMLTPYETKNGWKLAVSFNLYFFLFLLNSELFEGHIT